jgi:hemoglobin-like flavoprotein
MSADHQLLKDSLTLVAPVADELVATFYDRLFAQYPQVRLMFPVDMAPQRDKLLKALVAVVQHYDTPEALLPALTSLGRNHVRYGAEAGHYAAVGQILLGTLRDYAGDAWTPEVARAWERAYTFAAGTMMAAADTVRAEAAGAA